MTQFTESEIEVFSIVELKHLGFSYTAGPSIEPDDTSRSFSSTIHDPGQSYSQPNKRNQFTDVILEDILRHSVKKLNPYVSESCREDAIKQVLNLYSPQLIEANKQFHKFLTEGVKVLSKDDYEERGETVWLIDFQNPEKNIFYSINQFTVQENNLYKRPDIILFINGLPLVIIELKNPANKTQKSVQHTTKSKTTKPPFQHYFFIMPSVLYQTDWKRGQARYPLLSADSRHGNP